MAKPQIEHGYVSLKRRPGRPATTHHAVAARASRNSSPPTLAWKHTRNQVAVMRGPVLYCVESPDLPPGVEVPSVLVPSASPL